MEQLDIQPGLIPKRKSDQKTGHCPICNSEQLVDAFQVYYWKENLFDYSDCLFCRATFANPMPDDELISKGNNALVRLFRRGRTEEQEFREARQAYLRGKIFAAKLRQWKKKGKFLELGCYNGFFSWGVQENSDWEVSGLEISSDLGEFIQQSLGMNCYVGTLEQALLPKNYFDFVVCHDLIEHINSPHHFLIKLSEVLAPGGRVQIITPNGRQDLAFTRRAYQVGFRQTMILNHIMYFRPKTLSYALEAVGLSPIKMYCYDVRYAAKDFGLFGMGKPQAPQEAPSMEASLLLKEKKVLSMWTPEKLSELKNHKKTSLTYGFVKETLPHALSVKVPPRFEVGHEIYVLAEKAKT
jgi:2-polyprenyl-3-methyl-5-hydroxy-6-metoxy-1,4-benzoquinol methylase